MSTRLNKCLIQRAIMLQEAGNKYFSSSLVIKLVLPDGILANYKSCVVKPCDTFFISDYLEVHCAAAHHAGGI